MDKVLHVLELVLPVLVTLSLGYFAKCKKLIGPQVIEGIKTLVMSFMLPAVLLGAFYKTSFGKDRVLITTIIFLVCIIGLVCGSLLLRLIPKSDSLLPFFTTGFEAGMMGFGLYTMLFSAAETHYFASVELGQEIFVFTVYMALLNKRNGLSGKETIKSMFKTPVFWAILVGTLLSISGIGTTFANTPISAPIDSLLLYVGAPTGMLMIFVVGYQIAIDPTRIKSALVVTLLRTVLMALLCFVVIHILGLFVTMSKPLFWATILLFSLPAPFVLPIFSDDKEKEGFIATTLSIGTLFSIAFFVVISFLQ